VTKLHVIRPRTAVRQRRAFVGADIAALISNAIGTTAALVERKRLIDLPPANCGHRRLGRQHEDNSVGTKNELTKALLPPLAAVDADAVYRARRAL
jgi:hypothetical protein